MTISAELQQAIDGLQIQDVCLRWTRSECGEGFRPKYEDFSALHVQQMHIVRQAELFDTAGGARLLHVHILLGTRWVLPALEGGEPTEKALVEAEFVAEYLVKADIPQPCINEFAEKNASYHVWPYWREFLAAQTERLRLPRVILPAIQLQHHRMPASQPEALPPPEA